MALRSNSVGSDKNLSYDPLNYFANTKSRYSAWQIYSHTAQIADNDHDDQVDMFNLW